MNKLEENNITDYVQQTLDYLESRAISNVAEIRKISFRHSSECSATLHNTSLYGCLKVRWTDGKRSFYKDCCKGEFVYQTGEVQ